MVLAANVFPVSLVSSPSMWQAGHECILVGEMYCLETYGLANGARVRCVSYSIDTSGTGPLVHLCSGHIHVVTGWQ